MKLSRREPIQMRLNIKNLSDKPNLVSFEMQMPQSLALDKSGLKTLQGKQLGNIPSGKSYEEYFEVHARPFIKPGIYTIAIKAIEHYNTYDFVEKVVKKNIEIIVDE
ncbi:MAG TPA: hypothetical protein VJG83_06900 [archaeon]|nr:hypothetical protein [archaeon]